MAISPSEPNINSFVYTQRVDELLKAHLKKILDFSKTNKANYIQKMDLIDKAYARYITAQENNELLGYNQNIAAKVRCQVVNKATVNPIVISQVQSMTAYLTEVFASGYPILPVVSTPDKKEQAEALEGIIQDHMTMTSSIPELILCLQDAAKYNLVGWETEWSHIETYDPQKEITDLEPGKTTLRRNYRHVNKIRRLNLRNVHWDPIPDIPNVATEGSFLGETTLLNRIQLKKYLNYLTNEKKLTYKKVVNEALRSSFQGSDWTDNPQISPVYQEMEMASDINWDRFGGFETETSSTNRRVPVNEQGVYCKHTMYLRIIPSDFEMNVPNRNQVQIWKAVMINRDAIISFEPYIGAYGSFGMGLAFALEDGMGLQTQGYGEMAAPLQSATTELWNAYIQGARRAVMDRALYNPSMIRANDINSPIPQIKIPVVPQSLVNGTMDQAYRQIPFDSRGMETVMQNALMLTDWQRELSGMNSATRGQFQKGNKTRAEFDTIMGNAENRMRLPALILEHRMFTKIKEQLKLNLLMYGEDTEVISPRTGKGVRVDIKELQDLGLKFELGDGLTPASKLASSDFLTALLQMIMSSETTLQAFGTQVPGMIAHLAQLGGVRGFEKYADAALPQWQITYGMQQQLQQMLLQLQQQSAMQLQARQGELSNDQSQPSQ
ncbi:TPA: hypothetical protein NOS66_004832 [Pseudomonas aeruginosa]|nr:hypothetical protein [Pseudomonas aeruginosa]